MQYIYYASTPINTPIASPLVTDCALTNGFITNMLIVIPAGCVGLVGVQLQYASRQFFPINLNKWLTGDGLEVIFGENLDLTTGSRTVQLLTYNLDDTYQHTVEVVFTVEQMPSETTTQIGGGGGVEVTEITTTITNNDTNPLPPSNQYQCKDGSWVDDPSKCPETPTPSPEPTPTPTPPPTPPPTPTPIKISISELMLLM